LDTRGRTRTSDPSFLQRRLHLRLARRLGLDRRIRGSALTQRYLTALQCVQTPGFQLSYPGLFLLEQRQPPQDLADLAPVSCGLQTDGRRRPIEGPIGLTDQLVRKPGSLQSVSNVEKGSDTRHSQNNSVGALWVRLSEALAHCMDGLGY
jgi:hypothetical protein